MDNQNDQIKLYWYRMCQGDYPAFEKFYQLIFSKLFQYGLRLAKQELVEDCLQELFMDIWQQKHRLDHIDNPQAYLFRSLRNRLINRLKKNSRYQVDSSGEIQEFLYAIDPATEGNALYFSNKLQKAIEQLSPQQREVIYLLYFNNLNAEEVSEILQVSLRTVYNTSYNAIQKLRLELKESFGNLSTLSLIAFFCYFLI